MITAILIGRLDCASARRAGDAPNTIQNPINMYHLIIYFRIGSACLFISIQDRKALQQIERLSQLIILCCN